MTEIPLFKVFMSEEAITKVTETLRSNFIGQGTKVEQFERELSFFLQTPYVNTVNSCTSALTLALKLVGHLPGHHILTCPLSCFASASPIVQNGYRPIWIDIDLTNCNMSLDDLDKSITPTTKAILLVYWGGVPVDLDKLSQILYRHELKLGRSIPVIEDCAHAFGSTYKGRMVGTTGHIGCFSFGAIKTLTTSEGGAIVSPSRAHFDRVKLLRWYGIDRSNSDKINLRCSEDIKEVGSKYHMVDTNASIGLGNLPFIESLLNIQRANAVYYQEQLVNIPGLALLTPNPDSNPSYWLFTILVQARDKLIAKLKDNKIISSKVHERNDRHSCMKDYKCYESLPNLDRLSQEYLSIPVGWWVKEEDRERIVKVIQSGW